MQFRKSHLVYGLPANDEELANQVQNRCKRLVGRRRAVDRHVRQLQSPADTTKRLDEQRLTLSSGTREDSQSRRPGLAVDSFDIHRSRVDTAIPFANSFQELSQLPRWQRRA